ncbi:MAG: DinB family protein [Planctomycetota bacterium]
MIQTLSEGNDQSSTVAKLIEDYERGTADLIAAVSGLTDEQLRARPVPGKWSTLEVVCHIADADEFFADRMKRTIAMERPLLIGVDGILYLEALGYQQHDLQEELDLLGATRRQLTRTLRRLPPTAWQRTAVHSEKGLLTLQELLQYTVNHLADHLVHIVEKRRAMES